MFVLVLLLVTYVSINKNIQLVSIAEADIDDSVNRLQSCEIPSVMSKDGSDRQGLNPENISFLNWNIYKGNGDDWQYDLSDFARDHDVMTIQEALLDGELLNLLDIHELDWVMNTAFHLDDVAAGVMTAARTDVIHSCGFKDTEPLIRLPKATLINYYAINGSEQRLLVANIHGINFTLGISAYRKQLDKLYAAIQHHDGPMIIAGDFNSWSNDRMEEVGELVDKLSLTKIEYTVNNKTHVFGNAIDHIFYRQLELVNNKVLQVSSSDHNPISVDFRLQSIKY